MAKTKKVIRCSNKLKKGDKTILCDRFLAELQHMKIVLKCPRSGCGREYVVTWPLSAANIYRVPENTESDLKGEQNA